jgi:hypothetical protein
MGKPPGAVGESIDAGHLYRLVPNWRSHWDYARNRPEARAFRKDSDIGVSMLLKERISIERIFEIKPRLRNFAVCELSVEELLVDDGVWVKLEPDEEWGDARDAHVLVIGITKRRVDWLRELGMRNVVKPPGPPQPDEPGSF